jgi:hypothetical protein
MMMQREVNPLKDPASPKLGSGRGRNWSTTSRSKKSTALNWVSGDNNPKLLLEVKPREERQKI